MNNGEKGAWRQPGRPLGATLLLLGLLLLLSACKGTPQKAVAPDSKPVRVGLTVQPASSLALLANDQGFWRESGLEVTTSKYPSGKRALLEGLFAGVVDVVTAADVPIVLASFSREDFVVVAKIGQADNLIKIVARRDRGIGKPEDLRGKHLATQKGSAVHYFLDLFLMRHTIPKEAVKEAFLAVEELPRALAEGRIDAIVLREPYISEALRLLGERAVVFTEPGLYSMPDFLVVRRSFLAERPEAVAKLLQGLLKAEGFVADHPREALQSLGKHFDTRLAEMDSNFSHYRLQVNMDHTVILSMEEVGRWAMKNSLSEGGKLANALDFVDSAPLAGIKSEAVSLGR